MSKNKLSNIHTVLKSNILLTLLLFIFCDYVSSLIHEVSFLKRNSKHFFQIVMFWLFSRLDRTLKHPYTHVMIN